MKAFKLTLRFMLELVGVVLLAYWGSQARHRVLSAVFAVLAPAVLIGFWAVVVAPKARNRVPQDVRTLIGSRVLLIVAALFASVGQTKTVLVFAAAVAVNTVLLFVFS